MITTITYGSFFPTCNSSDYYTLLSHQLHLLLLFSINHDNDNDSLLMFEHELLIHSTYTLYQYHYHVTLLDITIHHTMSLFYGHNNAILLTIIMILIYQLYHYSATSWSMHNYWFIHSTCFESSHTAHPSRTFSFLYLLRFLNTTTTVFMVSIHSNNHWLK